MSGQGTDFMADSFEWIVKEREPGTKKPPEGRSGNDDATAGDEAISVGSAIRMVLSCADRHTLESSILPLIFLTSRRQFSLRGVCFGIRTYRVECGYLLMGCLGRYLVIMRAYGSFDTKR